MVNESDIDDEESVVVEDEEGADESEKDQGPEVPHIGNREPYSKGLRASHRIISEGSLDCHQ